MSSEPDSPQVNGNHVNGKHVNGNAQGSSNKPKFDSFFQKVAPSYRNSASNVTNVVIKHMLDTYCSPDSAHPISADSVVLDNACGPGTVTVTMLEGLPTTSRPQQIFGADLSENMIKQYTTKVNSDYPQLNISGTVVDAQKLTSVIPKDLITHAFMTFAVYFVPDSVQAIQEMYQTMRDGSICVITSWSEMGFMSWYAQAQAVTRPDLPPFEGIAPFWWRKAENVRSAMVKGGFAEDKVKVVPFEFTSKRLIDRNMVEGMIKMFTRGWNDDDREKFKENLESIMAEDERAAKEEHDGQMYVTMIALIGIGEK